LGQEKADELAIAFFKRLAKKELEEKDKPDPVQEKANKFADSLTEKGKEYFEPFRQMIEQGSDRDRVMTALKMQLLQEGMPLKDAGSLVKKLEIAKEVAAMPKDQRAKVIGGAIEFFALTNGGGSKTLKKLVKTIDRANASNFGGEINVGANPDEKMMFHEMGHHLEFSDPQVNAAASIWRDRRATGDRVKLSTFAGMGHYDDHEFAVPDHFISPYVGKTYMTGYTEVVSMGIESFSDPAHMKTLHDRDPEHFLFILGVIKHLHDQVSAKS
jgi:hypothetical protein